MVIWKSKLLNIRLSYTRQTDGTAIVLEETNYYPFGLRHTGYGSNSIVNSTYRYKYSGKEVQENGMYDFGARMYMPELARWGVIDPIAEQYRAWSPYNYAVNNPVSFIDPDGRMTYDWQLGAYRDNNGGLMGWSMNNWGDPSFGKGVNDSYNSRIGGSDIVSFISGLGDGAGGMTFNSSDSFAFLHAYFTNGGSVNTIVSLIDQLENAGWHNPISIKAKYEDKNALLEKVPALAELFHITKTAFKEDFKMNSPAITNGQIVRINMNKIPNILSYAFFLGHEMYGHVFANLFFKSKFSEITKIPESSTRAFSYFQEIMGIQWEMSMGSTRYGNRTASDAASFFYGPNGAGHEQSIIDRVGKDIDRLMFEWKLQYNIQKNKIK